MTEEQYDFLLLFGFLFIFFLIIAIPAGKALGKRVNNSIYGEDENGSVDKQFNVNVLRKRSTPHPLNNALMVNMIVFELDDGTRMELAIREEQKYSIIIEGDLGTLTYQGKKFIDFERNK